MSREDRSQKLEVRSRFLLTLYILCIPCCVLGVSFKDLPALDDSISPLDPNNHTLLFKRLVAAFDQAYARHLKVNAQKSLADDLAFYYLRQELQALIDMWRATSDPAVISTTTTSRSM